MRDLDEKTKKVLKGLKKADKTAVMEDIYRHVLAEYTKNDVKTWMEGDDRFDSISETERDSFADFCAERWAYNGDYDCDQSYWDNIQNLIDEEYENLNLDEDEEEDLDL